MQKQQTPSALTLPLLLRRTSRVENACPLFPLTPHVFANTPVGAFHDTFQYLLLQRPHVFVLGLHPTRKIALVRIYITYRCRPNGQLVSETCIYYEDKISSVKRHFPISRHNYLSNHTVFCSYKRKKYRVSSTHTFFCPGVISFLSKQLARRARSFIREMATLGENLIMKKTNRQRQAGRKQCQDTYVYTVSSGIVVVTVNKDYHQFRRMRTEIWSEENIIHRWRAT